MQKLKLWKWLLFAILSCSAINCASIPPPPDIFVFERLDQHLSVDPATGHKILAPSPMCMKMLQELSCGHGVAMMSGTEIYVGDAPNHGWKGKTWTEIKSESVHVPAIESFAPLETYLINTCRKFKCNSQLDAFRIKLDSLNGIAGAISNP